MKREQIKLDAFLKQLHNGIGKILTIRQKGNQHTKRETTALTEHEAHRRPNNQHNLQPR